MNSKTVKIISFVFSAFVVLGAFEILGLAERRKYEESLKSIRLPALTALCEYSQAVSVGLRTMSVSSDESLEDSAKFVREQASCALADLYCFDYKSVESLTEYFDEVRAFSENASSLDRKRATELSRHAEEIYYHTDEIVGKILNEKISLLETDDNFFENRLDVPFNGAEPEYSDAESSSTLNVQASIGKKEALSRAGEICKIESVLLREDETEYSDGAFTYNYVYGDMRIRICRTNGALYSFSDILPCGEREYSEAEALKIAQDFLAVQGIENTVKTRSSLSEFTASFEFAPKNADVVFLNSTVKAEVCLASGKITGYDASEYIKFYNPNYFALSEKPDISELLPNGAYPIETILCLKSIKGRNRLCYRTKCRFAGEYYYLYFDYYTLKNILTTE